MPDDLAVKGLIDAKNRGVDVRVLVPGPHVDAPVTRYIARGRYGPLLKGGITVYEYQPTFLHAKVLIVDDLWTSVGSANFDNRSFRLNDEANLNVLDAKFAADQAETFEQDWANGKEVTLEEWSRRPLKEKFLQLLTPILRTQL